MNRIRAFFADYYYDLKNKVDWPSFEELQSNTVTVLIASLIIAGVVALMDVAFNRGISAVYDLFT